MFLNMVSEPYHPPWNLFLPLLLELFFHFLAFSFHFLTLQTLFSSLSILIFFLVILTTHKFSDYSLTIFFLKLDSSFFHRQIWLSHQIQLVFFQIWSSVAPIWFAFGSIRVFGLVRLRLHSRFRHCCSALAVVLCQISFVFFAGLSLIHLLQRGFRLWFPVSFADLFFCLICL